MSAVMSLEKVLPCGSVLLGVGVPDKAQLISRAARQLAVMTGASAEALESALLAREALGSTGVGSGIALPHARLHILGGTHAVFLRLATPISFDSVDDKPVDLVCAIVAPDEPSAALLTAVSAISRTLRDAAKTTALRGTSNAADVRRILLGGDGGATH